MITSTGEDYVGHKSVTTTKQSCLPWKLFNDTIIAWTDPDLWDHNYCRSVSASHAHLDIGPWCFTNQVGYIYETCGIAYCGQFELRLFI